MAVKHSSDKSMRRLLARFEGRVQGVGFRFTAVAIASRFEVAGYVKNERDGSVIVVAEGEENTLLAFLGAVRASPVGRYIMKEDVDWRTPTGEFTSFDVEYGP